MNYISRIFLVMSTAIFIVACVTNGASQAVPRIDGASEADFDTSYANLVESVSESERRKLALALFSILLPKKCLSTDAVVSLTFLPASPKQAKDIRPCREALDGKSYQDIIVAADQKAG